MLDFEKTPQRIDALILGDGPRGRSRVEVIDSQARRLCFALALECHRHGYEVVSVDQITTAARLSKTTLYELFSSKEGLLRAAVASFTGQAAAAAAAVAEVQAAAVDPRAALSVGFEALTGVIAREPETARLTLVEGALILPLAEGESAAQGHPSKTPVADA